MSAPSVLTATTRTETGKKVSGLRKAGRIPAVVFGHGLASIPVSLDAHEFEHFRRTAHSNLIVELKVDGKDKHRVLVHGVQVDPRTRQLLHVDLFELKKGEEVPPGRHSPAQHRPHQGSRFAREPAGGARVLDRAARRL